MTIVESAFVDTTQWPHTRTLENLPRFIETFSGKSEVDLSKSAEGEGSPHTIVVCAAALRAADATRLGKMDVAVLQRSVVVDIKLECFANIRQNRRQCRSCSQST